MGLRLAWAPIVLVVLGGCVLDRSTGGLLAPEPGTGGNGGTGGSGECTAGADCPPSNSACEQPSCSEGVCGFARLPDGAPCNDTGQCFEGVCLAGLGEPCTIDDGCFGAVCVEGLCCETTCDETCSSCAIPLLEGTCLPSPPSSLDDDCATQCDGLGQCVAGELVWGHAWGSSFDDTATSIDVDEAGYSYVAVEHDNTLTIDGLQYGSSLTDFIVVRVDPMGLVDWVHQSNGVLDQRVGEVAVTADGGVVMAGRFDGDLDGLQSDVSEDGFVRKLDSAGQVLWTHKIGGNGFAGAYAVAAHATEDSVAAGGFFTGDIDFGSNDSVTSSGGLDGFVQRLGPGLVPQWRYVLAGAGDAGIGGMAFDGDDLWVAGSFTAMLQLDQTLSGNAFDVYLLRLDAGGQPVFSQRYGALGDQLLFDLAPLPDGGLVLVGSYTGEFEPSLGLPAADGIDAFVMVVEPTGELRWATSFTANVYDVVANTVDVDDAGNIVVGGGFAGATSFGGPLQPAPQPGFTDGFVVKLASDGTYYWHQTFGSTGEDSVNAVAVMAEGAVFAAGRFFEGIAFGPTLTPDVGGFDAFALQLTP